MSATHACASARALRRSRCGRRNRVAALIGAQPGAPAVELVHIRTEGDMRTDVPLWAVDGRAFFTKEIDRALLANEIDIAVHSLKDLSRRCWSSGIELAAVLEREDPRDALISARRAPALADLPPRRARRHEQPAPPRVSRAAAAGHQAMELRGNVPTRIEKLQKGEYDAIILATAGLKRLGLDTHISARLPTRDFPSAVSQGAIGVLRAQRRCRGVRVAARARSRSARLATTAERALLRRIEGGCQVPLGALATFEGDGRCISTPRCARWMARRSSSARKARRRAPTLEAASAARR